ncbi:TetR/AcrR family transcriptional regulator [Spongiibacter sp. KMU-166]|uniref:TetR/AcrR family transcriptional regulator n=1 Tax=Spongiibacter thalassae TaxID=2721624 RepID=A0ABX1GC14_9GAMM|nr:TetR/AcrR family transcriptional regulator [Spongiibacter thalassae]NKI16714.1 TetR/AcrR family transcriptional regulator [Spongiibacter thalassae]
MTETTAQKSADGRRQRTERSRAAIVAAAVELVNAGVLIPTAQQIAERAGVGLRTFFRHFDDMSTLFVAVDETIRDKYIALTLGGDRNGTIEERIEHAVEQHAEVYEQNSNIILTTAAQRWKYDFLRKNYAKIQRGLRKDLDDWLPEITKLDKAYREAVDAIASFEMWHRLREHQGLSKSTSREIITTLLKDILARQ